MKRFSRQLIALIAAVGSIALALAHEAQVAPQELQVATLRTGDEPDVREGKTLSELNDALAREICRRLAVRCTLRPLPFAEIIPGVESGRFRIGVGNVLHTPDRADRVLFSQPLWRSSSRLVGSAAAIRKFGGEARLSELRGVTIAVARGSQQQRHLLEIAEAQQLRLVETSSGEASMIALRQGRADFSLMPVRSAYFLLRDSRGEAGFVGPALVDHGLGGTVHVILPKSDSSLRREVDAALDAMRADGTFQRILRRYMPFLAD